MTTTGPTDTGAILAALEPLYEGTFRGRDLEYDPARRSLKFTLTHPAPAGRGLFGGRRHQRMAIHVGHITSYKQFLTGDEGSVYILDRAEIGRGGRELTFYFRPGDRAAMDVGRLEVSVEPTGELEPPHKVPPVVNPLASRDRPDRIRR